MKIVWKIIKGILIVALALVLLLVVFQKITRNKLAIGNIYIFQVVTGSMEPEYKVGDIIVVKKTTPEDIKIGDDVTYLDAANSSVKEMRITHRVISKREENGKYYFVTKGIANEIEDPEFSEDNLYGKVVYQTVIYSFIGRLMTNTVAYYLIFIAVGASLSYDVVMSHIKKDEENEETEKTE